MKLRITGFIAALAIGLTAGILVGNNDPDMKLLRYLNVITFAKSLLH